MNAKRLPPYGEVAAQLGVSTGSLTTQIHRLRKQYTATVREEIGRTLSDPADVDTETHELCEALIAAEGISKRYLGDKSARVRFLREARGAAKLRHSNVASVLHLGKSAGNYFYAPRELLPMLVYYAHSPIKQR